MRIMLKYFSLLLLFAIINHPNCNLFHSTLSKRSIWFYPSSRLSFLLVVSFDCPIWKASRAIIDWFILFYFICSNWLSVEWVATRNDTRRSCNWEYFEWISGESGGRNEIIGLKIASWLSMKLELLAEHETQTDVCSQSATKDTWMMSASGCGESSSITIVEIGDLCLVYSFAE